MKRHCAGYDRTLQFLYHVTHVKIALCKIRVCTSKTISEAFYENCMLATRAGACLSPEGEFAQEPEWISACSE